MLATPSRALSTGGLDPRGATQCQEAAVVQKLRILLSTWRLEVFGLVSRSWTQQFGEMDWFERRGLPLGRWVLRHPGPAGEPTTASPGVYSDRAPGDDRSGPGGTTSRTHPRRESAAVRSGPGPGSTILPPGTGRDRAGGATRESWPSADPCRRGPSRSTASFEGGASGLASGCRASGRAESVGPRPESSRTAAKPEPRVQLPRAPSLTPNRAADTVPYRDNSL